MLILAGSRRMLGAAALTSLAALRSGAGLVTLGVPRDLNLSAHRKLASEIMTWPLPQTSAQNLSARAMTALRGQWAGYSAIGLGPGMSTHNSTKNLVRKMVLESPVPLILDADALNNLSPDPTVLTATRTPKILTPHPGEMARLRGRKFADDPGTRLKICQEFARKYGCVVLLKGHHTVVTCPEGRHYINRTGNVGMATAGSGDVLTGMITALTGQGLTPFEAAKFGAYLHGLAGDLAAKKRGKTALIATDIIENISAAILAAK